MNHKSIFKSALLNLNKEIVQITEEKLFKKGAVKVDFSLLHNGKFVNTFIIDDKLELDQKFKSNFITLIEYLLAKESNVVLLYSEVNENASLFIEENLRLIHPNFFSSRYSIEQSVPLVEFYQAKVPFLLFIESLFNQDIYYYGPKPGYNRVGIELIKDECWNCENNMFSVSGIVFPNKKVKNWKIETWNYFHSNLNLSDLPVNLVSEIKTKIDFYRTNYQPKTCLIAENYSKTLHSEYWSSTCPNCKKMRGNYYLNEKRMMYLHEFSASINSGDLFYLGIDCQISAKTLNKLNDRYETNSEIIDWKIKENVLAQSIRNF